MTIVLQPRDREIIEFLRDQGVASVEQLNTSFFKNHTTCSLRLRKLEKAQIITLHKVRDYLLKDRLNKRFFPIISNINIHSQSKVVTLSDQYLKLVSNTKSLLGSSLLIHQLLLNDIRIFLGETLQGVDFFLNDPQLQVLSDLQPGRLKEFTPDLSIEQNSMKIAIELERTIKAQNRYHARFSYYRDSVYTHVIYYYLDESHLKMIQEAAGQNRKFGFAHYTRPNQVLSKAWGYLTLNEWISKVNSIKRAI